MTPVPSPCLNICALDAERHQCRSCGRTIKEIVAWPGLDEVGKRAVWARLEAAGKVGSSVLKDEERKG
ncbi:DUF1289 domain-containing protein [Novosphingobium profundi]|uniref:DUF1289 domain-containing protein n=1 Tax=Novosphingobium profundi TaxID=1774954 RepID=UPI001BDA9E19|nr:DUF1289 domain-containing protein [Novosphingobium profundi]MBT0671428.1 DUF1289 domain-containing protein [Novosphingobium profundi]